MACSCFGDKGCGSTPASKAAASNSSQGGAIIISEGLLPGPVNCDGGSTVKYGEMFQEVFASVQSYLLKIEIRE